METKDDEVLLRLLDRFIQLTGGHQKPAKPKADKAKADTPTTPDSGLLGG